MPKERPLWRGPAFRLCLLSAALFLCLQLGMRRSWCPEEKPRAPPAAAAAAGRALPPALGTEQHPAAAAAVGRRRVTYVRSGRRGSAAPGCCPLRPPGGRRRKVGRAGGRCVVCVCEGGEAPAVSRQAELRVTRLLGSPCRPGLWPVVRLGRCGSSRC